MPRLDLGDALRAAQDADPASIPDVVLRVAAQLGASDVVVYLVDFGQSTLEPLPARSQHAELPQSEEVASTMAGRAFVERSPVLAERPNGVRIWVPVVEGSDRTGVLAVTVPEATDEIVETCEELGLFVGYLIATQARATDLYNLHRRRQSLSLPASMQWDLLPPLVLRSSQLSVAGILEPAYEVGGDCFDYALNDSYFELGVFDPMGHGLFSALVAALCVGSYRHDRRESHSLEQMHAQLDSLMAEQFNDQGFATGQLARIDLQSGEMTWTNAGHPLPMLIRGGKVIAQLDCPPTLPWGLGTLSVPGLGATVTTHALEPGDAVLFFTDGVVEAHTAGIQPFGIERLADLASRHASDQLEVEEIVRLLVRAVLEHQDGRLADDATLVLCRWSGATA